MSAEQVFDTVLAPQCSRCSRRHLLELRCWSGRYAQRVTRLVLREQGTICWLCGNLRIRRPADSADHVIPRSRGGTDVMDNLRPAHHRCNARRRAEHPFPTPISAVAPSGPPASTRWRTAR
jgi:5-methylcytosine-specific restriction endonuclease McrA